MIYRLLNWLNINPRILLDHTAVSEKHCMEIFKKIYGYSVTIPVPDYFYGSMFQSLITNQMYEVLDELKIKRYYVYYDWDKFVRLRLREIEGEEVDWNTELDVRILFRNKNDALLFRLTM